MVEFMVAFAFTPGYEQEPQLNEMDFLEIDLLGPHSTADIRGLQEPQ